MNKIGDAQFRAMCQMWGVDGAIKASKQMGMAPSKEQVEAARLSEKEQKERMDNAFRALFNRE